MEEWQVTAYNDFIKALHLDSFIVWELSAKKEKDFSPPAVIKIENEPIIKILETKSSRLMSNIRSRLRKREIIKKA